MSKDIFKGDSGQGKKIDTEKWEKVGIYANALMTSFDERWLDPTHDISSKYNISNPIFSYIARKKMTTDFFLSMFERGVREISILMNIKMYNKVAY